MVSTLIVKPLRMNSRSLRIAPSASDPNAPDWTAILKKEDKGLRSFIANSLSGQESSSIDDVLQEVTLTAHATDLKTIDLNKAGAWLRQVAKHKAQDHWRKVNQRKRLRTKFTENSPVDAPTENSPADWVLKLEQLDLIKSGLNSLSPEHREVLQKKYLHGLSYQAISADLGITLKTLEYRLILAKQEMRKLLTSKLG